MTKRRNVLEMKEGKKMKEKTKLNYKEQDIVNTRDKVLFIAFQTTYSKSTITYLRKIN